LGFLIVFVSCEKDEDKAILKSTVTPIVLEPLSSSSYIFEKENEANIFDAFSWSEAEYGFPASVTYILQADIAGNNFSSPANITSLVNEFNDTILIGAFNKILLDKGLEGGIPVDVDFRIASIINSHVDTVYSNVITVSVNPFATTLPPIFMVGAATGGWDWNHEVEMRSIAPSLYYTVAYFINNETFRFFKQQDWGPVSYNFPYFDGGTVTDSMENALDGDLNFRVLSPSGYYAITVNLNTKWVDFDAVAEPKMFMTGAALGGWDWSTNYVQMTWLRHGIFEAETEFINGQTFRFFAQQDWNPTSYNFPFFADGIVDPLFENGLDGDSNFRFIGTTGVYKVTLNMLDLKVTMEAVPGK